MKIVLAMDSFKGCCSSLTAETAAERGLRRVRNDLQIIKLPIADGGEGTTDSLLQVLGGRKETVAVLDPLGRKILCDYGIAGNGAAIIEVAAASGLPLLQPKERDPMKASSYGTGQLIRDALDKGCRKVYLGLGGSATNDAGIGLMQALGVRFINEKDTEVGFGGDALKDIVRVDVSGLDRRLADCEILVLSDVKNPLCGEKGASAVFGPQKGATPEMVRLLDTDMERFGRLLEKTVGQPVLQVPGTGAAGGIAASLLAFCNCKICPGIDTILELLEIDRYLHGADLVVTGEGQMDFQTAYGKVPAGIATKAKAHGVPVVAVVGSIGKGISSVYDCGIDAVLSILQRPMALGEALEKGPALIADAAEAMFRVFCLGSGAKSR